MRTLLLSGPRHRALGYVLNEMLLAVAIFAAVTAIAGTSYQSLKRSSQTDEASLKFVALANDIRKSYRPAGSFTTLSAGGVGNLGIVQKPFYFDGTNVFDPWGNALQFAGSDAAFAIILGGNGVWTPQECTAFATAVQDGAYEVRIGTTVALGTGASLGRTTGGSAYKTSASVYDSTALQTGCSGGGVPNGVGQMGVSFDG
jgi:type II secretory pathway pseudopilin PulG